MNAYRQLFLCFTGTIHSCHYVLYHFMDYWSSVVLASGQVGTEEEPFVHKATITLHGTVNDPEIPIYGAKVLAVRQGQLDLHGLPRNVTWTRLADTADRNDTALHLQVSLG